MSDRARSTEVYADWIGLPLAARLGALHVHEARSKEVFSFEYDEAWLHRDDTRILDPELLAEL